MIIRKVESIAKGEKTINGYRLPFEKTDVAPVIMQGYDGPFSHFAVEKTGTIHDDTHSLDFVLDPGTTVLAAKDGILYGKLDGFGKCYRGSDFIEGLQCTPNLVFLLHPDGTFTLYAHLMKGSIEVEHDQRISQGQPLAKTGLSGWVGPVPHLHFSAFKSQGDNRITLPIEFNDYQGPLFHNQIFEDT